MPKYQWLPNQYAIDQLKFMNQLGSQNYNALTGIFPQAGGQAVNERLVNPDYLNFPQQSVNMDYINAGYQPGAYDPAQIDPNILFRPGNVDPNQFNVDIQGLLGQVSPSEAFQIAGGGSPGVASGGSAVAGQADASSQLEDFLAGKGKLSPEVVQQLKNLYTEQIAGATRDARGALASEASAAGFGQTPSYTTPLEAELLRRGGTNIAQSNRDIDIQNAQLGLENQKAAIQMDLTRRLQNAGYSTQAAIDTARNATEASVATARNQTDFANAQRQGMLQYMGQYGGLLGELASRNQQTQAGLYGTGYGGQLQTGLQTNEFLGPINTGYQNTALQFGAGNLNLANAARYGAQTNASFRNPELELQRYGILSNYQLGNRGIDLGLLNSYGNAYSPIPYFNQSAELAGRAGTYSGAQSSGMGGALLGAGVNIGIAAIAA